MLVMASSPQEAFNTRYFNIEESGRKDTADKTFPLSLLTLYPSVKFF